MPKRQSNRFKPRRDADDDQFETEALSYLNEDEKPKLNKRKTNFDTDSEAELSGSDHSDVEDDKLLLENEEEQEQDSDDEAPDSVAFDDSKHAVLAQFRSAMQQIDAEREKKKSNRKKTDAQYKEQKARKKEMLSKIKLPEDVLEGLDEEIPKKKRKMEMKKQKQKKKNEDITNQEDDLSDLDLDTVPLPAGDLGDDYISLTDSITGVEVAEMKYVDKKKQTLAQRAAEFRQNRLYSSSIPRTSNSRLQSIKDKRQQRHMYKRKL